MDSHGNAIGAENPGMTLQDWFAGMALPIAAKGSSMTAESIAKRAYYIADAMLAEREVCRTL
jgi:hypothetical protein